MRTKLLIKKRIKEMFIIEMKMLFDAIEEVNLLSTIT